MTMPKLPTPAEMAIALIEPDTQYLEFMAELHNRMNTPAIMRASLFDGHGPTYRLTLGDTLSAWNQMKVTKELNDVGWSVAIKLMDSQHSPSVTLTIFPMGTI